MLKKTRAFIMTDSILALLIISVGLGSLTICQVQLHSQQRQYLVRLTAARILKEASDGYRIHHCQTVIERADYRAVAEKNRAAVWYQDRLVIRL